MLKRKPGPWPLWNISSATQMISKVGGKEENPDHTYLLISYTLPEKPSFNLKCYFPYSKNEEAEAACSLLNITMSK